MDHVATVRQARGVRYPDPVTAAGLAELGGADQITIHLREDRRHIQERDLRIMRETVQTRLNLEMAATQEMVRFALEVKPDVATLVPERREELTTEGGLEVAGRRDALTRTVELLHEGEIAVSLFIDPELEQVRASHKVNADAVEVHTGHYCNAVRPAEAERQLQRIHDALRLAAKLSLGVAAGHGLHYDNIVPVACLREIEEFNIGHAIVARAILVGMVEAVREMKELIAFPG